MLSLEEKIEKHKCFLSSSSTHRPLCGCSIGGWENMGRYWRGSDGIFEPGEIDIAKIDVDKFTDMYKRYISNFFYDNDDLIRSVEPFQSIPWTEASLGCPVQFTGTNMWAGRIDKKKAVSMREEENPVIGKYIEFMDMLKNNFGDSYPTGQSIFRGPIDMASAAIGENDFILDLIDDPEGMKEFISGCTDMFIGFLSAHIKNTEKYLGGNVIGQYHIWTPGTCARLQEDAMSILSPDLFSEFALDPFGKVSGIAQYNLFHIHASALFLIDHVIDNRNIHIVQVSKDKEEDDLENMTDVLKKIQSSGKCLLLKGRLRADDIKLIGNKLDRAGLCIQVVVDDKNQADKMMDIFNAVYQ